ncbi:protein phosphatase Slingshot [Hetaerina americana]|uniref:protein phosphatase Slingshot n=1 Tax=Hetaerina americana TaxID=62018 RepID=UPI003A7F386C
MSSDIQRHLRSMFYLLRPEETLKMAVKLESVHPGRTRYLVVVSRIVGLRDSVSSSGEEESCLLGIDCNEHTTIGLVLRVLSDTTISLDGDGGFGVNVCGRQHIFKPVSVQAMWSALQTLHRVSQRARERGTHFLSSPALRDTSDSSPLPQLDWASYYESRVDSDQSCLNEWHAMDSLESRRPPSPDAVRTKPREREETERVIRTALKEIMMSVDLDEVTCKWLRGRLEEMLGVHLSEYKAFIDEEMLTILGQMDAATPVFDHVYLGSEWNASNLEELQKNGIGHILNVTREIDNFFPGVFDYLNVRVYDDEKTDLLKHWDNTFRYITRAKKDGSKVLVHCKMGVSRSASVVIAYAMKAYDWDLKTAVEHVKQKRSCIKPNAAFMAQLETYQGILDAMKNREKLQRSKSETNLKSPSSITMVDGGGGSGTRRIASEEGSTTDSLPALPPEENPVGCSQSNGKRGRSGVPAEDSFVHRRPSTGNRGRPRSWSPDDGPPSVSSVPDLGSRRASDEDRISSIGGRRQDVEVPMTASLERLSTSSSSSSVRRECRDDSRLNLNVRMPCSNGQAYSVSQNKVVHLPCSSQPSPPHPPEGIASVRRRVTELEARKHAVVAAVRRAAREREGCPKMPVPEPPLSPEEGSNDGGGLGCRDWEDQQQQSINETQPSSRGPRPSPLRKEGSGELEGSRSLPSEIIPRNDVSWSCRSESSTPPRRDDPFSARLDQVFDREERKQSRSETQVLNVGGDCPSRQGSWSSFDSAVVLGFQGEAHGETPSRQSSWGSGDARWVRGPIPPSRNGSWGSCDIRTQNRKGEENVLRSSFSYDREAIPWHPGTVKRTKQRLEEVGGPTNGSVWTSSEAPAGAKRVRPEVDSRLAPPPPPDTPPLPRCPSPREQSTSSESSSPAPSPFSNPRGGCTHLALQALLLARNPRRITDPPRSPHRNPPPSSLSRHTATTHDPCPRPPSDVTRGGNERSEAGMVRSLRKEFEARQGDIPRGTSSNNERVRSLPSSPEASCPPEDLSVRSLVDRFEVGRRRLVPPLPEELPRPSPPPPRRRVLSEGEQGRKVPPPAVPPRKSSLGRSPASSGDESSNAATLGGRALPLRLPTCTPGGSRMCGTALYNTV